MLFGGVARERERGVVIYLVEWLLACESVRVAVRVSGEVWVVALSHTCEYDHTNECDVV